MGHSRFQRKHPRQQPNQLKKMETKPTVIAITENSSVTFFWTDEKLTELSSYQKQRDCHWRECGDGEIQVLLGQEWVAYTDSFREGTYIRTDLLTNI